MGLLQSAAIPDAFWYTVKKYARLAEIAGMPPPTFRHSVATRLMYDLELAGLADPACAAVFGTIDGERLKRPPQGYAEAAPDIESFTASMELPAGWLACRDTLVAEIAPVGEPRRGDLALSGAVTV